MPGPFVFPAFSSIRSTPEYARAVAVPGTAMSEPNRNQLTEAALRALHLLGRPALNDGDTDASIRALAEAADTPVGTPAALCVYPRFVATAKGALAKRGLVLPVATVTNFPAGAPAPE